MTRFIDHALATWAQNPVAMRLGSVLLHSVWQGALIAVIAALWLAAIRKAQPQTKYVVLLVMLGAIAACPFATFLVVAPEAVALRAHGNETASNVARSLTASAVATPGLVPAAPESERLAASLSNSASSLKIAMPTAEQWNRGWVAARSWFQEHRHWITAAWQEGYEVSTDALSNEDSTTESLQVKIPLGETGKVTVRMKKK